MSKIEIKVPSIGESVTEVTLSTWLKKDGDYVKLDENLCELESEKATFELPSEAEGKLTIIAQEGADLKIGDIVCTIDTADKGPQGVDENPKAEIAPPKEVEKPSTQAVASKDTYASQHPSPAAKKILDEKGIDPKTIEGTGKDNRITKEDALKSEKSAVSIAKVENVPLSKGQFSRGEKAEKMSRLRRTISKRLVAAKNETAMLTTFNEVDMSRIMQIREQYKKSFEESKGIGLGFMSFFTKACSVALQKFPAINAYLEDENIVFHDFCDISIAVSTPKGLVVPVIRNAESLSFAEIENEVKRLATLGRDGNLTMDDMTGGTFTITNGGVFGSLLSTPIINQPQSAILGMHKIQDRPMAINGKVEIRPMMYVALSYDHRIVDGKESVGFLVTVKDMLENPEKMLYGQDPVKVLLGL
jgi:2-oxoglutarate dehydrogenase E2 component (dihydrolipoamide succinyltransferase)